MAKVYLKNETFTVSDSNIAVFGTTWGSGSGEDIRIADTASNVIIDANVEKIEFTGQASDYTFALDASNSIVPYQHLEIKHAGTSIAYLISTNQSVKLYFSDGSLSLAQTGKSTFTLNNSTTTTPQEIKTTAYVSWNSGALDNEKSTIKPTTINQTANSDTITLSSDHSPTAVKIFPQKNLTITNFNTNDTLDLFSNASVSVVSDLLGNVILNTNDGNNNSSKVVLTTPPSGSSIYNLPSFLINFNIILHPTLNNSIGSNLDNNFDGSLISSTHLQNNIIGSARADTIISGFGYDTITGGAGADTITVKGKVKIIQNTGDSLFSPIGSTSVQTAGIDVISGVKNGDIINLAPYVSPVPATANSLSATIISTIYYGSPTPIQYDNKVAAIQGHYDGNTFVPGLFSSPTTNADTLLVYDENPTTSSVSLGAIVLVGYHGNISIGGSDSIDSTGGGIGTDILIG